MQLKPLLHSDLLEPQSKETERTAFRFLMTMLEHKTLSLFVMAFTVESFADNGWFE